MKFKTRAIRFSQYQSEGNIFCVVVWVPFFFFPRPKELHYSDNSQKNKLSVTMSTL